MAIVHADNFSIYGTNTGFMLDGPYAQIDSIGLIVDPDGVSSGRVVQTKISGTTGALRHVLQGGIETTVGVALRVWFPALPSEELRSTRPVVFCSTGNTALYNLQVMPDGRLIFQTGGDNRNLGAQIAATTIPVIAARGWYHIEIKVTIDGVVGAVEVRVEGIPVIEASNLNLGITPIAQVRINNFATNIGGSQDFYVKDYVIWNDAGSQNNDFIGSVIVQNLTTTSDIALNWTPSVGSNGYSILDNIPPVDSEYIFAEDSPLPPPYVGTLSDLPPEVTSVKALVTFVRAAKNDGGDGSLQVGLISDPDGTPATVLGTNRPITVAQTYWRDVFEVDPATSAPWLPAAVNDAQVQINRTT